MIGTPQARWREITQSGLLSIMPVMRFSPCGGTQRVALMAASARARSVSPGRAKAASPVIPGRRAAASPESMLSSTVVMDSGPGPSDRPGMTEEGAFAIGRSIAMNHCGVLRKITGFFERQECGYWCLSLPRATSMPASIQAP